MLENVLELEGEARRAVEGACKGGVAYCDVRVLKFDSLIASVSKSKKIAEEDEGEGVAVRVLSKNGFWGYASSSVASAFSLKECALSALRASKANDSFSKSFGVKASDVLAEADFFKGKYEVKAEKNPVDLGGLEGLLAKAAAQYESALGFGKKIASASAGISFGRRQLLFANSQGAFAVRDIDRIQYNSFVVAASDKGVQRQFVQSAGNTGGLEILRKEDWHALTFAACKRAVELLNSVKTPVGVMTAVFSGKGGGTGLIAHEAVGHAVEGDYAIADRSYFNGQIGKTVGADELTLIDDGSRGSGFGEIGFDDEGVRCRKNVLIENGVFKTFLLDRTSAKILNLKPTGNARTQDQSRRVYVRMTNTSIKQGSWAAQEIIRETKKGVYCNQWKAGIEDPSGGSFQLFFTDGYIIRNGELCESLYNISVSQNATLDALKNVDAIAKDSAHQAGGCGKGHADYVPVGSGGPTMRVKSVVIGGE